MYDDPPRFSGFIFGVNSYEPEAESFTRSTPTTAGEQLFARCLGGVDLGADRPHGIVKADDPRDTSRRVPVAVSFA